LPAGRRRERRGGCHSTAADNDTVHQYTVTLISTPNHILIISLRSGQSSEKRYDRCPTSSQRLGVRHSRSRRTRWTATGRSAPPCRVPRVSTHSREVEPSDPQVPHSSNYGDRQSHRIWPYEKRRRCRRFCAGQGRRRLTRTDGQAAKGRHQRWGLQTQVFVLRFHVSKDGTPSKA
jgi:hypothetical protein